MSYQEAFIEALKNFGKPMTKEEMTIAARRKWIPYCCFTPLAIIRAHMNRNWLEKELKRRDVNRKFKNMPMRLMENKRVRV